MCKEAAQKRLCLLESILDGSMTQQQIIKTWKDDDYWNDDGINWYDEYKKRKAQKASIKEELMPIAWHPSRWWNWCVPKDQKKKTKQFFLII